MTTGTATATAVPVSALLAIPLHMVEPGPNVRGDDVGDVAELAQAIRAHGQLVPALVEQIDDDRYRLVDGHRRHKALRDIGAPHMLALLRREVTLRDRTLRQLAIQGNTQQFGPCAEARALHALMFHENMTREDIARQVGRSPLWVRDRIALLQLTPHEQKQVDAGDLSIAQALYLVAARRAARDGTPSPADPDESTPARRVKPADKQADQHFTPDHPLAGKARGRCFPHRGRTRIGGVACGECWEKTIREDALANH